MNAKPTNEDLENRYRKLIHTMQEGVIEVDAEWKITFINEAFLKKLGYSENKVVGSYFQSFVSREKLADAQEQFLLRHRGEYSSYELSLTCLNGEKIDVLCSPTPNYDAHGAYQGGFGVITDITEQKRIENLLKIQHNFNTLLDRFNDFLFVLDLDGSIIRCNSAAAKRLGYSREELQSMNVLQIHPRERSEEALEILSRMIEGETVSCLIPLQCKDNNLIPVETKVSPGKWNDQDALFGISRDISDRINAEQAKKTSDDRLRAAIEALNEGFALYDPDDCLAMFNARYLEIYKESQPVLYPGSSFKDILRYGLRHGQYPDAYGREEEWLQNRLAMHREEFSNLEQKLPNGQWLKVSERKTEDGSTVGFRVDITKIKKAEEDAKKSLKEKEILLREIHHRVKNNLQVISSLLSLQQDKIDDRKTNDIFSEAKARIHSMAIIHETLYQSDNLSEIKCQRYLENLISQLLLIYSYWSNRVDITIKAEEIVLNIEQAVPCGLIVTEIITNSLKHADPGEGSMLEISICADYESDRQIFMEITDNGKQLSSNFDLLHTSRLGVNLISELILDQLEGEFTINYENGVCWRINWPVFIKNQEIV